MIDGKTTNVNRSFIKWRIVNLWIISVLKKQRLYVRIKKMGYTEHKQTMHFLKRKKKLLGLI